MVVTGDLSEAFPNNGQFFSQNQGHVLFIGEKSYIGAHPALRPSQTSDFLKAMKTCPDIDTFTVPGNHDVGKKNMHPAGWLGYEKQFMESYFYFEVGQRVFIGLDSEVYKQSYDVATEKRQEQSQWLETLLARLPKTQPKTVFMHTPLFIEDHNEIASAEEGKTCDYKKMNTVVGPNSGTQIAEHKQRKNSAIFPVFTKY